MLAQWLVILLPVGSWWCESFLMPPGMERRRIQPHFRPITTLWQSVSPTPNPHDNDNDDDPVEELLFDDFDFVIGESTSSSLSPTTSTTNNPLLPVGALQQRIQQMQQEQILKDTQLAKNWKTGNWKVRGFSLDKIDPTQSMENEEDDDDFLSNRRREKDQQPDKSTSMRRNDINVCQVQHAGPGEIVVGRTDGSVCLVQLGTEYLTKFTAKLTAQEQDDATIRVESQLVRQPSSSSSPSASESSDKKTTATLPKPFAVLRHFRAHDQQHAIAALLVVDRDDIDNDNDDNDDTNDRILYTASQGSGEIRVWALPDDADDKVMPLRSLTEAHSDTVVALQTLSLQRSEKNDQQSHLLFSASLDGTCALWDLLTGDLVYKCRMMLPDEVDQSASILCADVDTTHSSIYLGMASGHVVGYFVEDMIHCASVGGVCPVSNGRFLAHEGGVTAIKCAGDGTLARSQPGTASSILLTGGNDGVVKQWEIIARQVDSATNNENGEPSRKLEHWPRLANQRMQRRAHLFQGHSEGPITALASIDPSKFISAGADGSIRAWNPSKGKELFSMDGFTHPLKSLCLNEDMLITDGMAEYVCVHDFDVDNNEAEDGYELEW